MYLLSYGLEMLKTGSGMAVNWISLLAKAPVLGLRSQTELLFYPSAPAVELDLLNHL